MKPPASTGSQTYFFFNNRLVISPEPKVDSRLWQGVYPFFGASHSSAGDCWPMHPPGSLSWHGRRRTTAASGGPEPPLGGEEISGAGRHERHERPHLGR